MLIILSLSSLRERPAPMHATAWCTLSKRNSDNACCTSGVAASLVTMSLIVCPLPSKVKTESLSTLLRADAINSGKCCSSSDLSVKGTDVFCVFFCVFFCVAGAAVEELEEGDTGVVGGAVGCDILWW